MPNLQTIPKKGRLAKPFRQCLVASPGCLLVEADLGSAEAVMVGWFSGDKLLARLSRLGFHKYLMAKKLGRVVDLNWPDSELTKVFDEVRAAEPDLYDPIKVTVYASFYLAGYSKVFSNNTEVFGSEREVKELQQFMFKELPGIAHYQQGVTKQKFKWNEQTKWGWIGNRLVNPFGYSAEYWDLAGTDGPAACAFLPQSTIGSLMKEALIQLWSDEDLDTWKARTGSVSKSTTPLSQIPLCCSYHS